jgi:hypothetical protein
MPPARQVRRGSRAEVPANGSSSRSLKQPPGHCYVKPLQAGDVRRLHRELADSVDQRGGEIRVLAHGWPHIRDRAADTAVFPRSS